MHSAFPILNNIKEKLQCGAVIGYHGECLPTNCEYIHATAVEWEERLPERRRKPYSAYMSSESILNRPIWIEFSDTSFTFNFGNSLNDVSTAVRTDVCTAQSIRVVELSVGQSLLVQSSHQFYST